MLQPSTGVVLDSTSVQAFGLVLTDDSLDDAVDSISAHVFGLMLIDDGLDNASQTSKLWSSRKEFQWRAVKKIKSLKVARRVIPLVPRQ